MPHHHHDSCSPSLARDLEITGINPPAASQLTESIKLPPRPATAVVKVNDSNLQSEIIDRSHKVPIFVLIGSPLQLGVSSLQSKLTSLAESAGLSWILAELDPDQHPNAVRQFLPPTLPAVYAVVGGTSTAVFEPRVGGRDVEDWINEVILRVSGKLSGLKSEEKQSDLSAEISQPSSLDKHLLRAAQLVNEGNFIGAVAIYDQLLSASPQDLTLLRAHAAVSVLVRANSIDRQSDPIALSAAEPDNIDLAFDAADILVLLDRPEEAIERLCALLAGGDLPRIGIVRPRLVELMSLLEPDNTVVSRARNLLANVLY